MADNGYANEVLVSTDWVTEHLDDPNVVVAEVDENPDLYDEGHIPGAVKLHWKDDLQDPIERDLIDKESFERLLGGLGIGNDTTLVLYGDKNNWFAAYAYWYVKTYGHADARILNGGRQKWIDEGRELTVEVRAKPAQTYAASERDESIRAYRDQVREWLGQGGRALVDVRSPGEYAGDLLAPPGYEQEGAQRGGHIPTAASIPWATAVKDDGTFKDGGGPARDLRWQGSHPRQAGRRVLSHRRALGAHLVRAARAARLRQRAQLRRLLDRVGKSRRRPHRKRVLTASRPGGRDRAA